MSDTLRARIETAYDAGSRSGLDALDCADDWRARIQAGTYRQHRVDAILAALTPATRDEVADWLGPVLTYHESYEAADALLSRWTVVSRGDGGE